MIRSSLARVSDISLDRANLWLIEEEFVFRVSGNSPLMAGSNFANKLQNAGNRLNMLKQFDNRNREPPTQDNFLQNNVIFWLRLERQAAQYKGGEDKFDQPTYP